MGKLLKAVEKALKQWRDADHPRDELGRFRMNVGPDSKPSLRQVGEAMGRNLARLDTAAPPKTPRTDDDWARTARLIMKMTYGIDRPAGMTVRELVDHLARGHRQESKKIAGKASPLASAGDARQPEEDVRDELATAFEDAADAAMDRSKGPGDEWNELAANLNHISSLAIDDPDGIKTAQDWLRGELEAPGGVQRLKQLGLGLVASKLSAK